jgi:hypothetical protein
MRKRSARSPASQDTSDAVPARRRRRSVEPALIEKTRSVTTDGRQFTIVNLPPGTPT